VLPFFSASSASLSTTLGTPLSTCRYAPRQFDHRYTSGHGSNPGPPIRKAHSLGGCCENSSFSFDPTQNAAFMPSRRWTLWLQARHIQPIVTARAYTESCPDQAGIVWNAFLHAFVLCRGPRDHLLGPTSIIGQVCWFVFALFTHPFHRVWPPLSCFSVMDSSQTMLCRYSACQPCQKKKTRVCISLITLDRSLGVDVVMTPSARTTQTPTTHALHASPSASNACMSSTYRPKPRARSKQERVVPALPHPWRVRIAGS
jgi:hypothetical protein